MKRVRKFFKTRYTRYRPWLGTVTAVFLAVLLANMATVGVLLWL